MTTGPSRKSPHPCRVARADCFMCHHSAREETGGIHAIGIESGERLWYTPPQDLLCAPPGEVIWSFDANRSFDTVNGVPANGASFDGPGPVVAGGMLYVLSGNAGFVGRPGNVLLAFSVE